MLISVQVEVDFLKIEGTVEHNLCCKVMVEADLTTSLCIPLPYYIYILCFRNLICCGWGYGCTLMLISVQVEVDFWKIEG